ncbi:uncharacterized protein [Lolium perenne]
MESKVHMVDEHHEKQQFKVREHKNPFKSKGILETEEHRDSSDAHGRIETPFLSNDIKNQSGGLLVEDHQNDKDNCKSKRKRQGEHGNGTEGTKTVKLVRGRFIGIVDEDEEDIKIVKSARRKYICDEDEDKGDISGDEHNLIIGDNHNTAGAEDGIGGLIAQTAIVELYGSLPIDEPIWSGMLEIGGEGYVPLEAHLLAKSCEKVWECSRSLQNMVKVAKIPRLDAEPKCFRVSRPTEDNIGLYFFPQEMRPNEGFDKLVKEVMDKNLILRAYVDEAEMLIFPSILLPERHQTFQGKHYLWGMFKRREDMVNAEGEQTMRGTRTGNGRQHCSRPCVGKKDVNKGARTNSLARPNESTPPAERTVAEAATPAPAADTATSNAPSRQAEHAADVVAEPVPAATSHAASLMLPADPVAADVTTTAPAAGAASSHAPSSSVSQRGMYGFIAPSENQKIHQLIQELEREGAVVIFMRGETIGCGVGTQ